LIPFLATKDRPEVFAEKAGIRKIDIKLISEYCLAEASENEKDYSGFSR
jgi:hypothetical protein